MCVCGGGGGWYAGPFSSVRVISSRCVWGDAGAGAGGGGDERLHATESCLRLNRLFSTARTHLSYRASQ